MEGKITTQELESAWVRCVRVPIQTDSMQDTADEGRSVIITQQRRR